MKTRMMPFLLVVLLLSVSLGTALADEIIIKISPDILVLHSGQEREVLSVHTNIACNSVDTSKAVTLNEIDMDWYKCDDRGNFVAKFNMDEVEAYLDSELAKSPDLISVDMTLKGTTKGTTTTEGVTFEGTDQVLVMLTTCKKSATTSFPMGKIGGARPTLFSKLCGPEN